MRGKVQGSLMERLGERGACELDVIGFGECSMDEVWLLPEGLAAGQKVRASRRDRLGGGQIATAMAAGARLGLRTAFAGAVGDDLSGGEVLEGLRRERVDVSRVRTVAGASTRSALVLIDGRSGERSIVELTCRRLAMPPAAFDAAWLAGTRALHLDATDLPAAILAARAARERGIIVSIDVDHARPGLDELLALCDVCITSQPLPSELTGERDLERALRRLEAMTAGLVGCTLGARGAAALDEGHLLLAPAFPTEVVDTTACGDTFHAAFLCALLEAKPVGEALRFANAAAALKCRDLGRRGCPTRAQVDALLSR